MSTTGFWRNGRLYYSDSVRPAAIWPANPEVWSYEDFTGTDTTDISAKTTGWKGSLPGTADALTLSYAAGVTGRASLLSGNVDNDHAFMVEELGWYGSRDACFEARLTLGAAVTEIGFAMGFSDTTGIANAGAFTLATTVWTTTAVEGAAFVFDTDATTDTIRLMGVKTNSDATNIDTSVVPVAGTYQTFRVELEDSGTATNARFYIDGVCYGVLSDVLLRTTVLTPFIMVGSHAAAGVTQKYCYVDYVKAWQNRS